MQIAAVKEAEGLYTAHGENQVSSREEQMNDAIAIHKDQKVRFPKRPSLTLFAAHQPAFSSCSSYSIMLLRRLAALSALSAVVSLSLDSPSVFSNLALRSILLLAGNFLSLVDVLETASVLLVRVDVLELLKLPLPVRLCKLESVPSAFSVLRSSDIVPGIAEWRRTLREALASSLMRERELGAGTGGEEPVNSKTAIVSLSTASVLTNGSFVDVDSDDEDRCSASTELGEVLVSRLVSFLSSFCRNGLPTSTSSSPVRPETADTGFHVNPLAESPLAAVLGAV